MEDISFLGVQSLLTRKARDS